MRVVINTHWHDDHVLGNQVYRDAFPGAQFIAHAATRECLPGKGVEAPEERAAFESDVARWTTGARNSPAIRASGGLSSGTTWSDRPVIAAYREATTKQ